MDITLVGGGWDGPAQTACFTPFLAAAARRAAGREPRIAFVWVDEGDGTRWGDRWVEVLRTVGPNAPVDVPVAMGEALDPSRLDGVDGVLVCGGLTPAYAESLAPAAGQLRALVLTDGVPYAGSSAGAAVAARNAVVGGWLDGTRVLCPSDSAEDLEELTVVPGLGLVDELVDVHASAWGTLPRLAAALARHGGTGLGLDEDTAWHVTDGGAEVLGRNAVHRLVAESEGVRWTSLAPGSSASRG